MKHRRVLRLIVGSMLVVVLTACATPQPTPTATHSHKHASGYPDAPADRNEHTGTGAHQSPNHHSVGRHAVLPRL